MKKNTMKKKNKLELKKVVTYNLSKTKREAISLLIGFFWFVWLVIVGFVGWTLSDSDKGITVLVFTSFTIIFTLLMFICPRLAARKVRWREV